MPNRYRTAINVGFFPDVPLAPYDWVGRYEESLAIAQQHIDKGRKAKFKLWERWGYWCSARAKVKLSGVNEAQKDVAKYLEIVPGYNLD